MSDALQYECVCGNQYSLHLATVCPRCFRWPKRTASYVAQEQENGCTAAAVAMVVGKTYDEVQRACHVNFNEQGVQIEDWYDYLFRHGYTFYRVYRVEQLTGFNAERPEWPPKPFAPIHLCSVATVKGGHAVVMLENGDVLDPARHGVYRLTDYPATHMVIGCFPVRGER